MNIRFLIIIMISCISLSLCAQDSLQPINSPELNELVATRDIRVHSVVQSFFHLVKVFIMLITNEQITTRVKAIEELIASIIQTAMLITNYSTAAATPLEMAQNIVNDKAIQRAMVLTIVNNSQALRFEPALHMPTKNKPDETTQKVISHFSVIVQSFFNIVQDPENSENVTPNLMNMLANIVTIGKEVIKRSTLTQNTARQEIILFVTSNIDSRFKQDLLTAFYFTVHRNGAQGDKEAI